MRRLKAELNRAITPSKFFPVRVAYVWFISFAAIALIAFLYYFFSQTVYIFIDVMTANFPASFNGTINGRDVANTFIRNVWNFYMLIGLLGVLVWSIMYSLRKKKQEGIQYA